MTNPTIRTVAYAIIALLVVYIWGNCRESAGASKQRLRDSTTVVDAHRHQTDRRVAKLAAESLELGGKLRRLARNDSVARGDIARLRNRVIRLDSLPQSPDSLPYLAQIAVRDSIIESQDSVIASQDSQLTIWRALAVERGELLTQALGERDSYRRIAMAWQRQANPGALTKLGRAVPWIAAGFVLAKVIR